MRNVFNGAKGISAWNHICGGGDVNDLSNLWLQRKSYNKNLCAETTESYQETFQSVNYTEQLVLSVKLQVCDQQLVKRTLNQY